MNENIEYCPNRIAIDFTIVTKRILLCLERWVSNVYVCQLTGRVYFRMEMKKQPNEKGLTYYDSLIDELLKHGIQPLITLNHFNVPLYLAKHYGGWANRKMIDFYCRLVRLLMTRYKAKGNKMVNFL